MGKETGFICRVCGEPLSTHPRCPCGALLGIPHRAGAACVHANGRIVCHEHQIVPATALRAARAAKPGLDCPICGQILLDHPKCAICSILLGACYDSYGEVIAVVANGADLYPAMHTSGAGRRVGGYWLCDDHWFPRMEQHDVLRLIQYDKRIRSAYKAIPEGDGPRMVVDMNSLPTYTEADRPDLLVTFHEAASLAGCSIQTARDRVKEAQLYPEGVFRKSTGTRSLLYNREAVRDASGVVHPPAPRAAYVDIQED